MTTKKKKVLSCIDNYFWGRFNGWGRKASPPPGSVPKPSASPAKKVRKKKAEASPAPAKLTSPEASTSPEKSRGSVRKSLDFACASWKFPRHRRRRPKHADAGKPRRRSTKMQARQYQAASRGPRLAKKASASPRRGAASASSKQSRFESAHSLAEISGPASPAHRHHRWAQLSLLPPRRTRRSLNGMGEYREARFIIREGSRFLRQNQEGKYVSESRTPLRGRPRPPRQNELTSQAFIGGRALLKEGRGPDLFAETFFPDLRGPWALKTRPRHTQDERVLIRPAIRGRFDGFGDAITAGAIGSFQRELSLFKSRLR